MRGDGTGCVCVVLFGLLGPLSCLCECAPNPVLHHHSRMAGTCTYTCLFETYPTLHLTFFSPFSLNPRLPRPTPITHNQHTQTFTGEPLD